VKVVREALVHILAVAWWDEGGDDEIYVADEEENGDWQSGASRRVPVVLLSVEVEIDEASSNKGIDDGKWVGYHADW